MSVIKTLKSKITVIYVFLVFIIAMIGVISGINLYGLGKAIDGLMTDNYRSIVASNEMGNSVDAQDKAILQYIQFQKQSAMDLFYSANDDFYKAFNIERNNITEPGEKDIVSSINEDYLSFEKEFSGLQDFQNSHSSSETIQYYYNHITPALNKVKLDLDNLTHLNETAMFNSKTRVKTNAEISLYVILIISAAAGVIGLIVSIIYTNKSLKPVYLLTETIKSIREGQLNKQAPVVTEDEIGILAREFNDMTKRLHEFEQSSKGNLLVEKNKSVAIVKSIPDPIIVLDGNYKITLLNDSCENLFDIKESTALNKHFLEVIRNAELYDHIFNVVNNNTVDDEKVICIEEKAKTYYFNITVTAVRNKEGKINGVVVLLKNITEFKALEKVRTDFIATISHELKTPLTSIMMGVGLMVDNNIGLLNEKQNRILDTIKEEVQKLTDLVSNLLKLSRIQSDRAIFDRKKCTIQSIADRCIRNYQEQAKNNNINLNSSIKDDLPEIIVDGEKITWVLNNLVSNALRYTDAGDEIEIGAYGIDREILVYVRDSGRGIPEEYQDKIFEKFVRVDSSDTGLGGTGLGLSIAKEIVEAHGGTIWCKSKPGEGSTFTFSLPFD